MTALKTPMDVLRLVDRSNCRLCGSPTCLAFAALVIKGDKQLEECPKLNGRTTGQVTVQTAAQNADPTNEIEKALKEVKSRAREIDIRERAAKLGLPIIRGKLAVPVLGKQVYMDDMGELSADIHLHAWLALPIYNYVLDSTGAPTSGSWVSLRELKKGAVWYGLFKKSCEDPLVSLIEKDPELFGNMVEVFNGRAVSIESNPDHAFVLDPLPRTPIMIAYWGPDEGIGSHLKILYDSTVEQNLNIESIYAVSTGLTFMFEKIMPKHFLA